MKKTLLSVLAILMVLTMVFSSTMVLSAEDAPTATVNQCAGELPDATGIEVDGKMDDAYQQSPALPMILQGTQAEGIYTRGTAYAAWSSEEEAIYFFFIVNDISICPTVGQAWNVDGVELFVKHGNDMTLDYNDINNKFSDLDGDGKDDWAANARGRQYRISGYDGRATCFIANDLPAGFSWAVAPTYDSQAAKEKGVDYLYNPDPLTNENGGNVNFEEHINATRNEFGWYKDGYAYTNFDEFDGSAGYTLEFKIVLPGLKAGDDVRFDFCILDRYAQPNGAEVPTATWWYKSGFRILNGFLGGDPVPDQLLVNYDYFTMGSTKVTVSDVLEEGELYDWGREDAMYPAAGDVEEEPPYQKTDKQTMDRQPGNAPAIEPVVSSSNTAGNDSQPDNNTTTTTTQAAGSADNGGCGSSIVLGSSVAMLALVGAAGAFAFRKKDEE